MTEDSNPHASPHSTSDSDTASLVSAPKAIQYPWWIHAFFFVNFAVAVLLCVLSHISIAAQESPYASVGGMIGVIPFLLYAIAEWQAWYRKNLSLTRVLGYLNLAAAALLGVGFIGGLFEERQPDDPPPPDPVFLFWLFVIGISVTSYLGASGYYRLQYSKKNSG